MNEAQTDALQQSSADLQERIDALKGQLNAGQQAIANAEALLPELLQQLAALKEGLPAPTVVDGGSNE